MGQPRTTAECSALADLEAQVECMQNLLFPAVVKGVAIGALAGAVLGGLVAFVLTRDPRAVLAGIGVGGIVGGVAGGVLAYYRKKMELAGSNVVLAANESYQDSVADDRKLGRYATAIENASDKLAQDVQREGTTPQLTARVQKLRNSVAASRNSISDTAAVYKQLPQTFEQESGVSSRLSRDSEYQQAMQGLAEKAERIERLLERLERAAAKLDALPVAPAQ